MQPMGINTLGTKFFPILSVKNYVERACSSYKWTLHFEYFSELQNPNINSSKLPKQMKYFDYSVVHNKGKPSQTVNLMV